MRSFNTIAFVLIIVALPFFVLLLNLNLQAFNEKFYLKEFEDNEVYEDVGRDLTIGNYKLLIGYFKNENGLEMSFFNDKEKMHLADVKSLISLSRILLYISIAVLMLAIIFLAYKKNLVDLRMGLMIGSFLAAMIIVLISLLILFDFGSLFLNFHFAFFSNDLWQLNPATDRLIQMFPEEFFFDAAINVLINSFVTVIVVFVGLFALKKITS